MRRRNLLLHKPDNDINVADPRAFGWLRQTIDADRTARNVNQFAILLVEEVVVVGGIGVEIRFGAVNRQFPQQPGLSELVQRVVYGRQRNMLTRLQSLGVQVFSRHVTVTGRKEQRGKSQPLPCGPQTRVTQPVGKCCFGLVSRFVLVHHGHDDPILLKPQGWPVYGHAYNAPFAPRTKINYFQYTDGADALQHVKWPKHGLDLPDVYLLNVYLLC